jgi:hypothetical protein
LKGAPQIVGCERGIQRLGAESGGVGLPSGLIEQTQGADSPDVPVHHQAAVIERGAQHGIAGLLMIERGVVGLQGAGHAGLDDESAVPDPDDGVLGPP